VVADELRRVEIRIKSATGVYVRARAQHVAALGSALAERRAQALRRVQGSHSTMCEAWSELDEISTRLRAAGDAREPHLSAPVARAYFDDLIRRLIRGLENVERGSQAGNAEGTAPIAGANRAREAASP
jgi:hypothetical protein